MREPKAVAFIVWKMALSVSHFFSGVRRIPPPVNAGAGNEAEDVCGIEAAPESSMRRLIASATTGL